MLTVAFLGVGVLTLLATIFLIGALAYVMSFDQR